jgi:gamma-glutamylcyclotransferase (GGCT)/AIG2-like uncharacterized protein YtfP
MAATKQEIIGWIEKAQRAKASHLIVATDTYDYEDYPVEVQPTDNVHEEVLRISQSSMQKVTEVYSFTGRHDVALQLTEHRAYHLD